MPNGLCQRAHRLAAVTKDTEEISAVLNSYQDALNTGSVEAVVKLYAQDGVCMPQHSTSSVGIEAIREKYEQFFANIKFSVKFHIIEVVPIAPEWAFARTESKGTTKFTAGGGSAESNQELFVFQKVDDNWKIARYCFSTTNPPH